MFTELLHDPRFWSGVAFVLFFVLFGKKMWTPLAAALDSRAESVRRDIDEAARLRQEAEQLLEQARAAHQHALDEARKTIEFSKIEAKRLAEEARIHAEETAQRREKMILDQLGAAQKQAEREIRALIADISVEATQHVIRHAMKPEDQSAITDRAITHLAQSLTRRPAA